MFSTISWPQFTKLNNIRRLPIAEQVSRYNKYLTEVNAKREIYDQYKNSQQKGTIAKKEIEIDGNFLLLENGSLLKQEDGHNIKIT
jgi:hypothetical protein|tara:strand:- start:582 stop:839 length:258 start_codon:yes stop_codon:yes gene_type:complete